MTEIKKDVETKVNEPDVIDVDLGFVEKRRFRIMGDYNRMLELNVSDLNIFARLEKGYEELKALGKSAQEKINAIPDDENMDLSGVATTLTEIDAEMRKIIDYIFDTNASEVCAPSGNMFDPVDGEFRFERIIDKLSTLYTNGLNAEFAKMKNKVENKARKYIKKGKR